jgi:transposase
MSTIAQQRVEVTMGVPALTIGLDLGDRISQACMLDAQGQVVKREALKTTAPVLARFFSKVAGARVVLEVGMHSPWISRLLTGIGLEVIVCNARKVALISKNDRKNDRIDAELLARLGRVDPELLHPIQHRSAKAQADLSLLLSRDALVRTRVRLITHVRGLVKSNGGRVPGCSADSFARKAPEYLPRELAEALSPVLRHIGGLTASIRKFNYRIEQLCRFSYPETVRLRQIPGVGPITALAYVLILDNPHRFKKSRSVGAYVGLVSRQHDSSDSRPQLRITKAGSPLLRRLLVGDAQYILGPFGKDCTLRRFGQAIAKKGGKNAKKRAVVAVARKLAVLLHRLWISEADYDALRNARAA